MRFRHQASSALQGRGVAFCAQYVAALGTLVRAELAASERPAHDPSAAEPDGLALMDESLVEADIEISRAAMLIEGAVEWEQRELQTFTSALRGESHVGAGSNPIRPALVAKALWQASAALGIATPQRVQALRATAAAIGGPLKLAFAAACSRLEAQGVEPSLYRTVVLTPGSAVVAGLAASGRPSVESPRAGALHGLLASLPAGDEPAPAAAAAAPGVDRRLIELVSRLFDAILADSALPAPAKRALARLQGSAQRIALRDPGMLDSLEHPTWRLLDRIASACQQAAATEPARLAALAADCERLAEELARHAAPDARLHREGLARLEALVAEDLRTAQQAAQGAIAALQRTERRRHLQAQVQRRLEEQFVRCPVGVATRHWLLGPSAEQIAEALLNEGPDGRSTVALTRTVDDLLWSLHPPAHPASRQRLVKLLPALLARLRAGMAHGAVPAAEQQAVLAELEASHSAILWPDGRAQPAATESPQEVIRRLREEVVANDAPARRDLGDSVVDLSTLDTVPAELMPDDAAGAGGQDAERVRRSQAVVAALPVGRAVRLLLQGQWIDVQLLWRSADGELLLFADRARLTHALTRRALERLHAEGLALLDAPASLVRRAVDASLAGLAGGR